MEKGSRYRGVSGTSGLFLSDAKIDPGPFTKKLVSGEQTRESGSGVGTAVAGARPGAQRAGQRGLWCEPPAAAPRGSVQGPPLLT